MASLAGFALFNENQNKKPVCLPSGSHRSFVSIILAGLFSDSILMCQIHFLNI